MAWSESGLQWNLICNLFHSSGSPACVTFKVILNLDRSTIICKRLALISCLYFPLYLLNIIPFWCRIEGQKIMFIFVVFIGTIFVLGGNKSVSHLFSFIFFSFFVYPSIRGRWGYGNYECDGMGRNYWIGELSQGKPIKIMPWDSQHFLKVFNGRFPYIV